MSALRPDIYGETQPTARKEHRCCECGITIHQGDTYQRASGLWDGLWDTYKTCLPCAQLRVEWQSALRWDELVGFGRLADHIHGHYSAADLPNHPKVLAFIGRCYFAESQHYYPSSYDEPQVRNAKARRLAGQLERAGEMIQEIAEGMEANRD
jgi:hypothetical protein